MIRIHCKYQRFNYSHRHTCVCMYYGYDKFLLCFKMCRNLPTYTYVHTYTQHSYTCMCMWIRHLYSTLVYCWFCSVVPLSGVAQTSCGGYSHFVYCGRVCLLAFSQHPAVGIRAAQQNCAHKPCVGKYCVAHCFIIISVELVSIKEHFRLTC